MRRTACVDVGSFPLQLLLRRHPDWCGRPAAVVSADKPLGVVVAVNRPARAAGVRVGMRYAAALSLIADLQAGSVGPDEVAAGAALIVDRLRSISPFVEGAGFGAGAHAAHAEPGVFWVDVSGLQRRHRSPAALARTIRRLLHALGFNATVVIGYTRFGAYLLARGARNGWLVTGGAAAERSAARRASPERLPVAPETLDLLEKLGVTTVGAFLRLPGAEVLRRLGAEAAAVHGAVRGDLDLPVQGDAPDAPFRYHVRLSHAEVDAGRLQRQAEALLDTLLHRLRTEDRAVEALRLQLSLEDGSHRRELIRPAAPTGERRPLADLISLRLRALDLNAGVEALAIDAEHVSVRADQAALFRTRERRDPAAGAEALARIRAQFGNRTVVRAVVLDEHLPEAQFRWEPVAQAAPQPDSRRHPAERRHSAARRLVRRVLSRPAETPPPRAAAGPIGPFLISGGWWRGTGGAEPPGGVDRAYYFVRSPDGALEWVYYDRPAGRWYLQGWVE